MHTSVHGVGHTFVQSAFKAFDLLPPYAVEEQKDPDPEFPTVKYPNPEEGKGVLVRTSYCQNTQRSIVSSRFGCFYYEFLFCRRCPSVLQRRRERL